MLPVVQGLCHHGPVAGVPDKVLQKMLSASRGDQATAASRHGARQCLILSGDEVLRTGERPLGLTIHKGGTGSPCETDSDATAGDCSVLAWP